MKLQKIFKTFLALYKILVTYLMLLPLLKATCNGVLSWNVKCNSDYSVKMTSHCAGSVQMREDSESGIRKWEEMWFKTTAEDGRLFHRRAAATGNALSPTVDRRVRRTSRDVDEAERSRRLTAVYCLLVDVSHRYVSARPCWYLYAQTSTLRCVVMPGFHYSVAVLPLPFRRYRYTYSVRITLLTWKKSLAPLPFPPAAAPWLPFRSN